MHVQSVDVIPEPDLSVADSFSYFRSRQKRIYAQWFSLLGILILVVRPVFSQPSARDFFAKGDEMRRDHKYMEAIAYFEQTMAAGDTRVGDSIYIDALYNLVYCLQQSGNLSGFIKYEEHLLAIKDVPHSRVPELFMTLGIAYRQVFKLSRALEYYDMALEVIPVNSSRRAGYEGLVYHNKGVIYRQTGDYQQALLYYQKWVDLYESGAIKATPWHLANTLSNIAVAYKFMGNLDEARENYESALLVLEKDESPGMRKDALRSIIYVNLGTYFLDTKQYPKALEYYQRNFDLKLLKEGRLKSLEYIGRYFLRTDNPVRADSFFHASLELKEKHYPYHHPSLARSFSDLGEVQLRLGELDKALSLFQEAVIRLTDGYDDKDIYSNPQPSEIYFKPGILSVLALKGKTLRTRGLLNKSQSDLEASLESYRLAAVIADDIKRNYWSSESKLQLIEESIHIFEGGLETAISLFEFTGNTGILDQAYLIASLAKATLLREVVRENHAQKVARLPDSLRVKEQQLKVQLADVEMEMLSVNEDSVLRALKSRKFDLVQELQMLVNQFEQEFPEYYRYKYTPSAREGKFVRKSLKSGTSMIEYFQGNDILFAFSLSKESISLKKILPARHWIQKANRFNQIIRNYPDQEEIPEERQVEEFAQLGYELFQTIIEPLLERKSGELIVVPDGYVASLPFGLMITRSPQGIIDFAQLPYLMREYRVRYSFSENLNRLPLPSRSRSRLLLAGFAPSYQGENIEMRVTDDSKSFKLRGLVNNQPEVKEICGIMAGDGFYGVSSTEKTFREKAPEYRILHIASHAFSNPQNPGLSGLAFTQDSLRNTDNLLRAYEISLMELKAELIVLSACETGTGKLAPGEGVMSLARAFAYAGSPNTIMSYWQVDDYSTRKIMTSFYTYLKEGWEKDQALQQAKIDYLNSSDFDHPFYWGAFVLVGDNAPVMRDGVGGKWPLIVIMLIIFVTGGVLVHRFKRRN